MASTWRFNFTSAAVFRPIQMVDTGQADLRIVGAAVHRHDRRLHVLRDRQRPACQQRAWRNRHVQALRTEGQLSGGRRHDEFSVDLATVTNSERSCHRRAAVDVPIGGRRHRLLHDDDGIRDNAVADFSANLYVLTYAGGAAYDSNATTERFDNNDTPIVKTLAGRATAPFIVDQHLYFGTAGASGRKGRSLRRSRRLQQRYRPGWRADPVVAGDPLGAVSGFPARTAVPRFARRPGPVPAMPRSRLIVPDAAASAAASQKMARTPQRSSSACFVISLAVLWV